MKLLRNNKKDINIRDKMSYYDYKCYTCGFISEEHLAHYQCPICGNIMKTKTHNNSFKGVKG